ncbi:related to endoglucanase IV precursor [Cephalotrichum gorgonifer]|uniref:lytic cellulose monooxygenase (C4-dehydrogenating) n=1 Tax=Cephalotrichum gorgonifer TaxID=2041049 RepID=A0AAE8N4I0_9PEZI|nr:related to endoglucanase IV precursor [Cephalotrichum gorgonifer]
MPASLLLAAISGAVAVSAHGFVTEIVIDGESHVGYNPTIAPWQAVQDSIGWQNWATDTGFVNGFQVQDPDIICHLNSTNAPITARIAAGSDISLRWSAWADSHHGPIIDYIANCNGDCTSVDKTTLEFVKIAESGQFELGAGGGTPGYWAADTLFETNLTWVVTIPESLAPGNYVLRHEIIALHGAYEEGSTQFYPQCINLEITGSGTDSPKGVVGTELYKSDDPGVLYNIYNDETKPTYTIPGPPLWTP